MSNKNTPAINDTDTIEVREASEALNELSIEAAKIDAPEKFCDNYDEIVKILNNAIKYADRVPFPVVVKAVIALKALREILAIIHSGFCPVKNKGGI